MADTSLSCKPVNSEPDVAWAERLCVDRSEDVDSDLVYVVQDKEKTEHYVLKLALEQNYLSPIENPLKNGIRVLDIGCSSAQWILDMANEYPESKFVGIDNASVYPVNHPANVEFVQCNVLDGIPFDDATFDFVFQRSMGTVYRTEEWEFVIQEIKRVLKPGGHAEFSESTGDVHRPGETSIKLYEAAKSFMLAAGCDRSIGINLPDHLMSADFSHVRSKCISIPLGWSGPVGELFKQDMRLDFEILSPFIVENLGMSSEEYAELVDLASKEWPRNRSWVNWYVVYAKKAL